MKKLVLTVAAIATIVGLSNACESTKGEEPVKEAKAAAPAAEEPKAEEAKEAEPEPAPEPEKVRPTKRDIDLKVKVTERQCFGSAGCNVTVQVTPLWKGVDTPKFDGDYDVTYRITGDESGPIIGTFTMYANGKYDVPYEEMVSTSSVNTPVDAQVTTVEETLGGW